MSTQTPPPQNRNLLSALAVLAKVCIFELKPNNNDNSKNAVLSELVIFSHQTSHWTKSNNFGEFH